MTVTSENPNRISTIVRACRLIGRMSKARQDAPQSHILYYQMLADYFTRVQKAREESRFIVAHTIFFPVEILYAMDLVPMHTELTAWMTALFTGNAADLLSTSSEVGMAPEICSPYRVLTGALAKGAFPRPDTVVWTNFICDNAGKGGELVMHMSGCSGHFMDCPFGQTQPENAYLKQELQDLIKHLEDLSEHILNLDKLGEKVTEMDRQLELYREINELRKNVPSPFLWPDFLKLFVVDCLFAGQPEATAYLTQVRQELLDKIKKQEKESKPERFRILSLMMPPVLLADSIEKFSREQGAVFVADPFFCQWGEGHLDPQKPLESVLTKISLHPVMVMYGPLEEKLLQTISDCSDQHQIDGAIFFAHISCRQSSALIKMIKDKLNEKGIPVLILDSDIIDITITPEEEWQKKLRQFFELLEDR